MRHFPFWKWIARGIMYGVVIVVFNGGEVDAARPRRKIQSRSHIALDMPAPRGWPVHVTAAGVVTRAEWGRGYGNVVYVQHDNGIETRYAHLSQILVLRGQTVSQYEVIGLIGSTGRSTGPHLHYEIRIHGKRVRPTQFQWALPIIGEIVPIQIHDILGVREE